MSTYEGLAMAQARSNMDGSSWLFNLFCINPCVGVWLIKSAYGIDQNCWEDCLSFCLLTRCYINQIYQTTLRRGNPTSDGGSQRNNQPFPPNCCPPSCGYCCYGACCPQCMAAQSLNKNINFPCWMGLCCVNAISGVFFVFSQLRFCVHCSAL